jgi:3-oxoadipate enol-lactonase
MPTINVRGIEINYRDEGAGFPLLLIHGLSDTLTLWTPLMSEFSNYYRVIAMDVRGHGCSSKPDMPYSIGMFSEDLRGFLDRLEIPQAHLLGLSMGGAIAQRFTLDYPESVASLILLSSFYHCDSGLRDTLGKLREIAAEEGLAAFFDEAVKLVVSHDFVSAHREDIAEMKKICAQINSPIAIVHAIDACLEFDASDRISQVSLPTLILSGNEDIFVPPYLAEQIHRCIRGSEWRILTGVGHNLVIPEKTLELTRIILEFLGRLTC